MYSYVIQKHTLPASSYLIQAYNKYMRKTISHFRMKEWRKMPTNKLTFTGELLLIKFIWILIDYINATVHILDKLL